MPYRARPIRHLRPIEHEGWRLKLYGISAWSERPDEALVTAALPMLLSKLPSPATDGRHGVGFAGVHEGRLASFAFVSWWAKTYELNHFLWRAPRGTTAFEPVEQGLFGCTWDLHVIAFERDAWIASMLGETGEPDLDSYLRATFSGPA